MITAGFPMSTLDPGLYDLYVLTKDTKTGRQSASAGRLKVIE